MKGIDGTGSVETGLSTPRTGSFLGPKISGVNVDRIDVLAGAHEAALIGYASVEDQMVTEYALQRWARGEEEGAMATFRSHGIDMTSAYRIVAAARAAAERTVAPTAESETAAEEFAPCARCRHGQGNHLNTTHTERCTQCSCNQYEAKR